VGRLRPLAVYAAASTVRGWADRPWFFLTAGRSPVFSGFKRTFHRVVPLNLALTALQGPLMEWYTSIINLTVAAVLLVILVASRRWRDE
jgi:hypothetical protein